MKRPYRVQVVHGDMVEYSTQRCRTAVAAVVMGRRVALSDVVVSRRSVFGACHKEMCREPLVFRNTLEQSSVLFPRGIRLEFSSPAMYEA